MSDSRDFKIESAMSWIMADFPYTKEPELAKTRLKSITADHMLIQQRIEGLKNFQQLRDNYTSNLLSNGAAPKDVQELLGHSDVSIHDECLCPCHQRGETSVTL